MKAQTLGNRAAIYASLALVVATRSGHADQPPASPNSAVFGAREGGNAETARSLYREGAALARSGKFEQAIQRFSASFALFRHATTLFNIGYCQERRGDAAAALRELLSASMLGAAEPARALSPEYLERANELRRALAARVGRVVLEIDAPISNLRANGERLTQRADADGALWFAEPEAALGDSTLTGRATLVLNPGPQVLTWSSSQGQASHSVTVQPGAEVSLRLMPNARGSASTRLATPEGVHRVPAPAASSKPASDPVRNVGIGAVSVGGVLVAVGLGAGISAIVTNNELAANCDDSGVCPPSQDGRIAHFQTMTTVATVGVLGGVALASAGLTILLTRPHANASAGLKMRIASSIEVSGEF